MAVLCTIAPAADKPTPAIDEPLNVGPGVQAPELIGKVDPNYTPEAEDARIQGEVLLSIVVDKSGVVRDISVLSPLGYGLDEEAIKAVSKWRFRPATKDGKPVSVNATVDVAFSSLGSHSNQEEEHDRTRFNSVVSNYKKAGKPSDADVKTIRELVNKKYPPAEYVLGLWELHGIAVPKDMADGMVRIQAAADRNYGPALFFIGNAKYRGEVLPKDAEAGLKLIHRSAALGVVDAEYMLAQMYEKGIGVNADRGKATRYYRLCAAKAIAECEFQLGQLLLTTAGDRESARVEATTWLELAQGHHFHDADAAAETADASLTADEKRRVKRLKAQLEKVQ